MPIYQDIVASKLAGRKLIAILLDPDKINWDTIDLLISKISSSPATHILVGGSIVTSDCMDRLIIALKQKLSLPVILFPGHPSQISHEADGILFLSLLSGNNPDFLIGHHITAAPGIADSDLEIIPTGYLLIESGGITAVQKASGTTPLASSDVERITATAQAGEMLGKKLIYLEAGSGAMRAVPKEIISKVRAKISIPLIAGGGIRSARGIEEAFNAGADLVVIGTAFENDLDFFEKQSIQKMRE